MTSDLVARRARGRLDLRSAGRRWPLIGGFALIAAPTLVSLAQQSWTLEIGAHGPIVLATGAWLLVQSWPRGDSTPGQPAVTALIAGVALPLYVFGRAYDFISLEVFGLWGVALAALWQLIGRVIAQIALPLLYLGLLVPPPGWLIDQATAPLQRFVSFAASEILFAFGYPIMRTGVVIFIAQYQLLVEQACSGMNSIMGLVAISLFYIYVLYRSSWRYAGLLVAFILPIAVLTNIVRVIVLVLITYHMGDAAAQGFLHMTTGIVLFGVALILMVALDGLLQRVLPASFTQGHA